MSAELTTSDYTSDQARRFTDEIKRDGQALWEKVAEAYDGRIWIALGYEAGAAGWQAYIADEFPDGLLIPPKERINDAIQHYLSQGMSTRAISQVTDLNQSTVVRRAKDLREVGDLSGDANASPGNVQGFDGKTYSPPPRMLSDDNEVEVEVEVAQTLSEGERPSAENPGFESIPLQVDQLERDSEELHRTLNEFNGSGAADAHQIKNTAGKLSNYLSTGKLDSQVWESEELAELAKDTVDVVTALADMLSLMADGTGTDGVSRIALGEAGVDQQVVEIISQLEELSVVIRQHSPAAAV